jgi:type III secretion protein U
MSDEKTEEPSEHKLRKAREEGQVAKSQDAAVAASTLAVFGVLHATADGTIARLRTVIGLGLDFGARDIALDEIYKRLGSMTLEALMIIGPLALVAALGATIGLVSHVGLKISTKALEPKFDSLNPAQGIKKVFSVKSLISLLQMVLKAVVLGFVLWQAILQLLPLISGAVYQSPSAIGSISWSAIVHLMFYGIALFIVLAPADFALQRHFFMKGQRMSKDEVKREFKSQEGDPQVKGQRKQLARELAEEAPAKLIARADAVIVNPTHYAVAIRYRADEAGVPVVLAKGVDDVALRIRARAEALGVPVFAHPPLARALHKVDVDDAVPEDLFEAVATVLRWVDEIGSRGAVGAAD